MSWAGRISVWVGSGCLCVIYLGPLLVSVVTVDVAGCGGAWGSQAGQSCQEF